MFNLEQSIAEWRQQMLAAGIKFPVPLEELESHLREQVAEQVQSGVSEHMAFETTVAQIGQGRELQTEFAKERGWRDFLRGDMSNMSIWAKLLLFVWIAACLIEFTSIYEGRVHSSATWSGSALLIISLVIIAITAYMAGSIWSIFLINCTIRTRNAIQAITNAVNLIFIICIILFILFRPSSHSDELVYILYIPFYFNVFTGVHLQCSMPRESKKATN